MSPHTLRILCFGDSLTAGFYAGGRGYHPYAIELRKRLQAAFPNTKLKIEVDGVPGELASSDDFIGRMREQFCDHKWDWTIVLGGTNDLGCGRGPDDIFPPLKATWGVALAGGSKILGLTVPEVFVKSPTLDEKRDSVNASIMGYNKAGYFPFDLKSAIPYHSLSDAERRKYWNDGIHLTPAGYDWMGGHIANALIDILKREPEDERPSFRREYDDEKSSLKREDHEEKSSCSTSCM